MPAVKKAPVRRGTPAPRQISGKEFVRLLAAALKKSK